MSVKKDLPDLTHAEVIRRLQLEIEQTSAAAVARRLGISQPYLSMVMTDHRLIGPKMLRALKLRRVTLVVHRYEPVQRCANRRVTVRKLPRGGDTVRIGPE